MLMLKQSLLWQKLCKFLNKLRIKNKERETVPYSYVKVLVGSFELKRCKKCKQSSLLTVQPNACIIIIVFYFYKKGLRKHE